MTSDSSDNSHPGDAIPFNRPSIEGNEIEYIRQSLEHGHTSADGPFSKVAAEVLKEAIGGREVLLTTSCTAARRSMIAASCAARSSPRLGVSLKPRSHSGWWRHDR